ncbi:uncharacterized protein [Aegilops tauschii subsp. strangulata]|uniref:uncharacterized protein n=1 Tax=Aegilops tauschii subsp. strangulata TaxID=200361 RepID=UPI00098B1390|nr:uncharacterized protein LOC109785231 [Aegilops tauschii subsp. strangulata]
MTTKGRGPSNYVPQVMELEKQLWSEGRWTEDRGTTDAVAEAVETTQPWSRILANHSWSTYPCASSSHSYLLLRSRSSDIPSLGPRNRCLPNRTSRNLAEQLICPSSSCSPSSLPGRWRRPPNSCVDVTASGGPRTKVLGVPNISTLGVPWHPWKPPRSVTGHYACRQ